MQVHYALRVTLKIKGCKHEEHLGGKSDEGWLRTSTSATGTEVRFEVNDSHESGSRNQRTTRVFVSDRRPIWYGNSNLHSLSSLCKKRVEHISKYNYVHTHTCWWQPVCMYVETCACHSAYEGYAVVYLGMVELHFVLLSSGPWDMVLRLKFNAEPGA